MRVIIMWNTKSTHHSNHGDRFPNGHIAIFLHLSALILLYRLLHCYRGSFDGESISIFGKYVW
jgi:hypothetical protein